MMRRAFSFLVFMVLLASPIAPRTLAAYDALRGADLLMRDHFRGVAERLEENGIGGEILARLRAAESRYLERIERIHAVVGSPLAALHAKGLEKASSQTRMAALAAFAAARGEITAALEAPAAPILRASVLPYRPASLASRPPRTEPLGRVTTYDHDDGGTELVYDKTGNVKEEHWANGNVVVYTYDGLNRLTEVKDSLGEIATIGYDARGNQTYFKDANGNETWSDYDDLDRMFEQRLPENRTVGATYDVAGNMVTVTNARITTTLHYDMLERLVETVSTEPFSYKTSFTYDVADNVLTEVDRRGILTTYVYDRESRRRQTARAGLVIEELEYDKVGNVVFVTDANLHKIGFEYDERGLVLAENRPLAAISRYTYDAMGNRVSSRDPEGRLVTWSYDLRQRPDPMNPPSLHRYLYGFQNPTVCVDPDGRIEFLRRLKERFMQTGEDAVELSDELGKMNKLLGRYFATPLGVMGMAAEFVGGAIGLVNTVTNVAIAASGLEGELAEEATMELEGTTGAVKDTVKAIVEHPGAVGAALVDGVVETGKQALEGDPAAITRATKTL